MTDQSKPLPAFPLYSVTWRVTGAGAGVARTEPVYHEATEKDVAHYLSAMPSEQLRRVLQSLPDDTRETVGWWDDLAKAEARADSAEAKLAEMTRERDELRGAANGASAVIVQLCGERDTLRATVERLEGERDEARNG